jgi:hypothetical protein
MAKCDISIVFDEVERLSKEPGLLLTKDEIRDYEEIRILREIVLEMESPKSIYYTTA